MYGMEIEREKPKDAGLVSEIITTERKSRAKNILGWLTALFVLLAGVIWRGWLFGLMARIAEAIPKQVLGAIIALLLLCLGVSLVLGRHYFRQINDWKKFAKDYSLVVIDSAIPVYAFMPSRETSTPPHWFCSHCFPKRRRDIGPLIKTGADAKGNVYFCRTCGNTFQTSQVPSNPKGQLLGE